MLEEFQIPPGTLICADTSTLFFLRQYSNHDGYILLSNVFLIIGVVTKPYEVLEENITNVEQMQQMFSKLTFSSGQEI